MADPVTPVQGRRPHEMPLTEARMRLPQLVRLANLADQVTIITDGGRPIAALVPVAAARSNAEAQAAAARAKTVAAGWAQRLDTVRGQLGAQHAAEQRVLADALAAAWELLDSLRPSGTDRAVDELRAAHRHHLGRL